MEINTHRRPRHQWRTFGIAVSIALFVLSIAQLVMLPHEDAGMWRGIALSSLYLVACLSQRRLWSPARAYGNRRAHD